LAEVFARGTPLCVLVGPVPGGPVADGGGVGSANCCNGSVHAAVAATAATAGATRHSRVTGNIPTPDHHLAGTRNQLPAIIYHLFDSTKLRLPPQARQLLLASSLSGRELEPRESWMRSAQRGCAQFIPLGRD
jgi:hypothetical protein